MRELSGSLMMEKVFVKHLGYAHFGIVVAGNGRIMITNLS